jgi:hypothetical protein
MPVTPDPDQKAVDTILAVTIQHLRSEYSSRVRTIAMRWADGLKGLLGLSGLAGLAGAPIAANTLTGSTRLAVGCLLSAVFLASTFGLFLVLSAASGTTTRYQAPRTMTELARLQRGIADRAVWYLRLGRAAAALALVLFGIAVTLAWVDPGKTTEPSLLVLTREGGTYCGTAQTGPDNEVALQTSSGTDKIIPIVDIRRVTPTSSCPWR